MRTLPALVAFIQIIGACTQEKGKRIDRIQRDLAVNGLDRSTFV